MSEITRNTPKEEVVHDIEDRGSLNDCCLRTIDSLSANNSMMVCGSCKQIIKTFEDQRSYRNYLTFCRGRSRVIETGAYSKLFVVVYHSYDA